MRAPVSWFTGIGELLALGVATRFRFRGVYWRWRWHTAFGRGAPASKAELLGAVFRYGQWIGRMRRL